jgi:hypothetical protein
LVIRQDDDVICLDPKGVRKLRKILKEYDLAISRKAKATT